MTVDMTRFREQEEHRRFRAIERLASCLADEAWHARKTLHRAIGQGLNGPELTIALQGLGVEYRQVLGTGGRSREEWRLIAHRPGLSAGAMRRIAQHALMAGQERAED